MEQRMLDIRLQLEMLITEREGLIAENQYRIACGNQVAYTEDNFQLLREQMGHLIDILRA